MPRDYIDIERLTCRCIVGIYPEERQRPQVLTADIRMWLDLTEAATTGALAQTCDYGAFSEQAAFVLGAARFKLLESAALCLVRLALLPPAPGEVRRAPAAARASLRKPHILPHPAIPAVTIERRAADLLYAGINGQVTEIFSSPEIRLTRVAQPGKPIGCDAVHAVAPGLWLAVSRLG